jgi:hypothetical protein
MPRAFAQWATTLAEDATLTAALLDRLTSAVRTQGGSQLLRR